MEWLDVLRRIGEGEGSLTEFKSGISNFSAIEKAICAFANDQGGVVILGVDDLGAIVGVPENPDKVQERLTNFLQSGCSVPVSASLGHHKSQNGWVHWINVSQQRGPEPIAYRGRVWIRRGRSSVVPSPGELQSLFNTLGFVLTEEQFIQSSGIGDIDIGAFRTFLETQNIAMENGPQPSIENDLLNRGVVKLDQGMPRPTLYGLIVFGKDPQRHRRTGNFYIQCTAYAGDDRASEVILTGESMGRLDEQVSRSLGWVKSLGRTEKYSEIFRIDRPLIPEIALREALVNAVIHRDYAITGSTVMFEVFRDRVAVTSPGSLPNHMSVESALAGGVVRSRNESMAHAMVTLGLMESRGRGGPVMRHEMNNFNGTVPSLVNDELSRFVQVRFHVGTGVNSINSP